MQSLAHLLINNYLLSICCLPGCESRFFLPWCDDTGCVGTDWVWPRSTSSSQVRGTANSRAGEAWAQDPDPLGAAPSLPYWLYSIGQMSSSLFASAPSLVNWDSSPPKVVRRIKQQYEWSWMKSLKEHLSFNTCSLNTSDSCHVFLYGPCKQRQLLWDGNGEAIWWRWMSHFSRRWPQKQTWTESLTFW